MVVKPFNFNRMLTVLAVVGVAGCAVAPENAVDSAAENGAEQPNLVIATPLPKAALDQKPEQQPKPLAKPPTNKLPNPKPPQTTAAAEQQAPNQQVNAVVKKTEPVEQSPAPESEQSVTPKAVVEVEKKPPAETVPEPAPKILYAKSDASVQAAVSESKVGSEQAVAAAAKPANTVIAAETVVLTPRPPAADNSSDQTAAQSTPASKQDAAPPPPTPAAVVPTVANSTAKTWQLETQANAAEAANQSSAGATENAAEQKPPEPAASASQASAAVANVAQPQAAESTKTAKPLALTKRVVVPKPLLRLDSAPARYQVQPNDTWWSVAAKFVDQPWRLVEIWRGTAGRLSPYSIYVGDTLIADGAGIRVEASSDSAAARIPTFAASSVSRFFEGPRLVSIEEFEQAPFWLSAKNGQVQLGGRLVVPRGRESSIQYQWVRGGNETVDPETSRPIALWVLPIAKAQLVTAASPPAVKLTKKTRRGRAGDRLLLPPVASLDLFVTPRAAAGPASIRVIKRQRNRAGGKPVVTLAAGTLDGIREGQVLTDKKGRAQILVIRAQQQMSYGLVMKRGKRLRRGAMLLVVER